MIFQINRVICEINVENSYLVDLVPPNYKETLRGLFENDEFMISALDQQRKYEVQLMDMQICYLWGKTSQLHK